jgi:hypothetical protein
MIRAPAFTFSSTSYVHLALPPHSFLIIREGFLYKNTASWILEEEVLASQITPNELSNHYSI